jgi:hypothetical protein
LLTCSLLFAPRDAAAQFSPTAVDDSYTVEEDSKGNRFLVLENDSAGFGSLRISDVGKPDQGGRVSARSRDTELEYEPDKKFTGVETFTYEIRNSLGLRDTATVTVTVMSKSGAPGFTSTPPTSVDEDNLYTYAITATDPDGDPLTIDAPVRPAWLDAFVDFGDGTALLSGTPTQSDIGDHDVTITVSDGDVDQPVEQSFTVTVIAVNEMPVAVPDAYTGNENTTLSINAGIGVLANDTDPDGDSLTAVLDNDVSNGTLILGIDGAFIYTPDEHFTGADSFTYRANDGDLSSPPVQVAISIDAVNDPPSFSSSPPLNATEDRVYSYEIQATDPDGDQLTIAAPMRPMWLDTFIDNRDGTALLSGTPTGADIGSHDVVLTVSDGVAPAEQQSFRIIVGALGSVDMGLTIEVMPSPALIDEPVEWTLTVANPSPDLSVDEVTLDAVFSGAPFVFTNAGVCPVANSMLSCVLGPMPPGSSLTVSVSGRATQSGDVLVIGDIGSPIAGGIVLDDPNPDNNVALETLNVGSSFSSGPAQSIAGSSDIQGLAAGDIDGDGFSDLVVATDRGSSTRVYFSVPMNPDDPNGQEVRRLATAPVSLGDTDSASQNALLADFDNDNDLDLAIANGMPRNPQGNTLFINDLVAGQANFVPGGVIGFGTSYAIQAADLDNNGFLDLVAANDGPNEVFLNSGTTFTAAPAIGNADSRALVVADFDGDLNPDVVFANADSESELYRGLGGGQFGAPIEVDSRSAVSVRAADLNQDGRLDLVFGIRGARRRDPVANRVFLNTSLPGSISFIGPTASLGTSPTLEIATADFSLDGRFDVAALNETGTHQIFAGEADGTFTLQLQQFSSGAPTGAAVADFNNDGRPDLAVARLDAIDVFLNDGHGNLGPGDIDAPTIRLLGQNSFSLVVGDSYLDPGASATDAVDGDLSSRIVITNPVDTAVIGTYTVTYDVADRSGNKAAPVTRRVTVATREAAGGGGGGSFDLLGIACLLFVALLRLASDHKRSAAIWLSPHITQAG